MGRKLKNSKGLLVPNYKPIILLYIGKKDVIKNAIEQYMILKKEFDLHTVIIYSLFYCKIFDYNIVNHKTL